MSALPLRQAAPVAQANPVRVLLVDDSAVIRGLVSRWLTAERRIELVGTAVNGKLGVEEAAKHKPDVVILDIEMPVMDGITALPEILKVAPGARVIMASTLTKRGAEVTIKALSLGASEYLPKPEATSIGGAEGYKRDLIEKVVALGQRPPRLAQNAGRFATNAASQKAPAGVAPRLAPGKLTVRPEALFIGSSTGGPEALYRVIAALAGKVQVPVFITQHMPAMFTRILAEHLSSKTGAKVIEAQHDAPVEPGVFHIAPGDHHMTLSRSLGVVRTRLNQDPPVNFCRPAVDPMLQSAATLYGAKALTVILTGMGSDGREGVRALNKLGGYTIVQDQPSSVVWGMPGAVAEAGLANTIKPLEQVAPAILQALRGATP